MLELKPDVVAVTGDHSTPAVYGAHSWHPVPVVLSGKFVRPDNVTSFGETAAVSGGLGRFEACYLINELLSAAGKLQKYGLNVLC